MVKGPPPPLLSPLTETLSSPTVAMSRAWPAIGTLLEALPSSIRGYVLAEVPDADWELELGAAAGLQIRWLDRRAGESWQNSRTSTVMRSTMAASSASLSLRSTARRSAFLRFLHAECAGPGGLETANNFLNEPQVDSSTSPPDVGVQLGDSLR